jgi:hypothetical protein
MSEVEVPYGDSAQETAVLLLAAADELELDPAVVRTLEGGFMVPEEVAKEAGVDYDSDDDDEDSKPARKTAAKKSTSAKK